MLHERWYPDVLTLLLHLLTRANRNRLPHSLDDWRRVADRLCLDLSVHRCQSRHEGLVLDDVVCIRWHPAETIVLRRIAHEIVEYLLRSEWEAPYQTPSRDTDRDRHALARQVEALLVTEP